MYKRKKKKSLKQRLKRLAPKVPDFTCPDIDFILTKIEASYTDKKPISKMTKAVCVKKLERLRTHNEQLRESGVYWYDVAKKYVFNEEPI